MYLCLDAESRAEYARVSLQELAAVVAYSQKHRCDASYPAWRSLSAESRRAHVPDDAVAFLASCLEPAWMAQYTAYGWLDLHAPRDAVLAEPTAGQLAVLSAMGHSDDAASPEPKRVKVEPTQPVSEQESEVLEPRELQGRLMQGSVYKPFTSDPCDIGQVVRGLAAILRLWGGEQWTRVYGIVNAGCDQHSHLLKMQLHCRVMFCIVYSPTHWSLLVLHRPEDGPHTAFMYDSLQDQVCEDSGRAFLLYVTSQGWTQENLELRLAQIPKQQDTWSCGHRVVATADRILAHLSDHGALPNRLEGPTDEDVSVLIATASKCHRLKLEQLEQKREAAVKRCKAEPAHPASAAAAAAAPAAAARSCLVDDDNSPRTPPPRASKRLRTLDSPAESSEPATPPATKIARAPRLGEAVRKAKAKSATKDKRPSDAAEKPSKVDMESAVATCLAHDVTHTYFQKAHVQDGRPAGRGEWHVFLAAVLDDRKVLTCRTCLDLAERVRGAGQQVVPAASSDALPDVSNAPGLEKLGESCHQRGRPKKNAAPRWSIHVFIRNSRADIYRQTPGSFGKSVIYECLACARQIRFGSATCSKKIEAHEAAATHQRGLRRLRGEEPAAQPIQLEAAGSASAPGLSQARACCGVSTGEPTLPLHAISDTMLQFMHMGQPRIKYAEYESDPLQEALLELQDDQVVVRSKKCEKSTGRGALACRACVAFCRGKPFRQCVAQKAYFIDLLVLLQKLFHASPQEQDDYKRVMQERDYIRQGLAGDDLSQLLSLSRMDIGRRISAKFESIPAWRISDSLRRLLDHYLLRPHVLHASEQEALAYGSLCTSLSSAIASGTTRERDLCLAAKVATGGLRADSLVEGLATSFLLAFKTNLADRQRRTTSAYCNYEALSESLVTLGRHEEVANLLRAFRVNPKQLQKLRLDSERFPQAFLSLSLPGQVEKCFQQACGFMKSGGTRMHVIVDETTWSAAWEQVTNLRGPGIPEACDSVYIGGPWSEEPDQDLSILVPQQWKEKKLGKQHLAKLGLHAVVQRPDCASFQWDVMMLPKKPGVSSADEMLSIVATLLDRLTTASGGVSPTGVAFDGGTPNSKINQIFLALLDRSTMDALPFFSSCQVHYPDWSFWAFGYLTFREKEHMVTFNGAFHWLKRLSLQMLSGCRKIYLGGLWLDVTHALSFNLPEKVYVAADPQNDLAGAMLLSPPWIGEGWSSLGAHVMSLLAGLFVSATTGSVGYTKAEIAENAFSGYYFLLLIVAGNEKRFGAAWKPRCLAEATVKNGCALAHYCVVSSLTGFEPRFLQEIGIERHFSALKMPFRGSPSLKDYLYGNMALNSRQARKLQGMSAQDLQKYNSTKDREPLSMEALKLLSKKGCASAVQLYSCISDSLSATDAYGMLRQWWSDRGQQFFRSLRPDALEDEDLHPDVVELLQGELPNANAEILQTLEDRAKISEEIIEVLETENRPAEASATALVSSCLGPGAVDDPCDADAGLQGRVQEVTGAARTLRELLRQCQARCPIFDTSEESSKGRKEMLKRAVQLQMPIRDFVRQARLEERLLSATALGIQPASGELNAWNERQHELALANRAAGASQLKLARATQWYNAQKQFCEETCKNNAKKTHDDPGLKCIHEYRPHRSSSEQQVIAFTTEDEAIAVGVVLSVFRGSIVRKAGASDGATSIRTSRPFPEPLPSTATKLIHVAYLVYKQSNVWETSCAEECGPVDPVGHVLGELSVCNCEATRTRLHVRLTESAIGALAVLCEKGVQGLPRMPAMPRDEPVTCASDTAAAAATLEFTDRSFFKSQMPGQVEKFFRGVAMDFGSSRIQVIDAEGFVTLNGKKEHWETMVKRIPAYFFQEFRNLQGYRFSAAVHYQVIQCLPSKGPLS